MSDAKMLRSFKEVLQREREHSYSALCPNCGALMTPHILRFYFSEEVVDLHVPVCSHCAADSAVHEIRFAA